VELFHFTGGARAEEGGGGESKSGEKGPKRQHLKDTGATESRCVAMCGVVTHVTFCIIVC